MGLLDKFKKTAQPKQKTDLALKKKEAKKRKQVEEEQKKKQFQSVGSAGVSSAKPKKDEVKDKKATIGSVPSKVIKEDTGEAYKVLLKPIITEKMTSLSVNNQYGFMVSSYTNKIEVKKAVTKVYGVTPIRVRIINVKGKAVRTGKQTGVTKKWKKAVVTLKQGDKIEIYETVK